MESPRALIAHGLSPGWLLGGDRALFDATLSDRLTALAAVPLGMVLLAEADPSRFLAGFLAACATGHSVALGNPRWGLSEWQQAVGIAQPQIIWGDRPSSIFLPDPGCPAALTQPVILIATGGSSGQLRFATHTWATLTASVQGFQSFFPQKVVNSCCVLPLFHVSGLMQAMRSLLTGGTLALVDFAALEAGTLPNLDPRDFFLSLVPTQLQRLLQSPQAPRLMPWLQKIHTLLLGGAPPWPDLLTQAREAKLHLAPTYGMTETASQIATQLPADFLVGRAGYRLLPHAQVQIQPEISTQPCPGTAPGLIRIQASSLAQGYYPHSFLGVSSGAPSGAPSGTPLDLSASGLAVVDPAWAWATDDLGYLDAAGRLQVVGRASDKIITGGENVFPAEVEAAIWATGGVQDVAVLGVGDRHWGERVVAFYVPTPHHPATPTLAEAVAAHLSRFKVPKQWIALAALPRNAQGKLNRAALLQHFRLAAPSSEPL